MKGIVPRSKEINYLSFAPLYNIKFTRIKFSDIKNFIPTIVLLFS